MSKGIQAEIKQSKPFNSLEEEAFIALLRTSEHLSGRLEEMLKPYGLSPTQYNALRILRGAGQNGLSCSEIGGRMINRDPDITRLVDRLEKRGLVQRSRGREDRRVVLARATPMALDLLKKLDRPLDRFHQAVLGHIERTRLQSLLRILEEARGGQTVEKV